jgi:hypothetical protein
MLNTPLAGAQGQLEGVIDVKEDAEEAAVSGDESRQEVLE